MPAELLHDLQLWSEDEVSINKRQQLQPQPIGADKTSNQTPGAKRKRNKAINIDKFINNEGIQTLRDKNVSKRSEQVARNIIRVATKVKNPKTFKQIYKTLDGKILTYTPITAWVQNSGKQPRLLRNSGVAFVPNLLIYGPCRPSRLSDYVAYKSTRRSGPCLRFLDIEDPTATQHSIFREDEETGLIRKLTRKEQTTLKAQSIIQNNPTKRRGKPTGERTAERPCDKPRGMSLSCLEKITKTQARTTETITHSDTGSNKSSNSEAAEPSAKRINQK